MTLYTALYIFVETTIIGAVVINSDMHEINTCAGMWIVNIFFDIRISYSFHKIE